MTFDVYFPFTDRNGVMKPGIRPFPKTWTEIRDLCGSPEHKARIAAVRTAQSKDEMSDAKKKIPSICFVGICSKTRALQFMEPTGLVMIDIDHCREPMKAFDGICGQVGAEWFQQNCLAAHITVSGEGLRLVFRAQEGFPTLEEQMEHFNRIFNFSQYGDFDKGCKDFSRISFLPLAGDFLYQNADLAIEGNKVWDDGYLVNNFSDPPLEAPRTSRPPSGGAGNRTLFSDAETIDNFSDEEVAEFEAYEYRGTLLKTIIAKWVEVHGKPGKGEIHNYYNEMIKYFRNICSNNKRCLLYLLPRFGHSAAECWSSIISITKVSTLSTLPRPFYFFLKDNGFYNSVQPQGSLAEYMMSEEPEEANTPIPWLPPVFREFVKIAPQDFRTSMVNALLPVMGTLTSYLQAPYYYDGRLHTTSFFSIIYAPAGTGKGFVERIMEVLFEQLKIRDYIQQARETIYLSTIQRKGDNEKAPADPHTTPRIIPPKNSEAEFLQKMKDNCGYHMFTYAAEMDSWAKGVKAAGGNKDDMIRIAWDNGKYGQQFKTANSFKGTVNLYWNVLITGTIQQLFSYFKNVENGLITRCSFTTIENQEFAEAPIWKELSKNDLISINKFMVRCDNNTYTEPCDLLPQPTDVDCIDADNFDREVKWKFNYRDKKTVNMNWLRPTIDNFLETQRKKAATDFDKARDVFRRRVAVRGFRLGLMCHALWEAPREYDLKKCIPFIEWWMEQDLENSLKLWGTRYNNETEEAPTTFQKSLFNEMLQAFTKSDVYAACVRMGLKTPVRQIIYQWKTLGIIKKTGKDEYEKIKPKQ